MKRAFFGVILTATLFSPVILADGCMLVPSLAIFLAALGPINGLAAEKPTCARCGGIADGPPRTLEERSAP